MTRISSAESPALDSLRGAPLMTPAQAVTRLAGRPDVQEALAWFVSHASGLTERQMEVTRIPAPPFGESHRAEWMCSRFVELGLQEVHVDGAGNVTGIRPGRIPGSKMVMLSAHMDTVFPPGTPIDVRQDGKRLLGPGISDNGAGLAALLAIATVLGNFEIRHSAPILFLANVGEEGEGDLRGMRYIFQDARWLEAIGYTLVLDGGGTDTIITQGLGSRRFMATVRGPGGHSWTDFGVPNPIVMLARAIDKFARTPVPTDPKTAFNIGVVHGGTSVNSIPEAASMKVDMRSASPEELERMELALSDALAQATESIRKGGAISIRDSARRDDRRVRAGNIGYDLKLIGNRPAAELAPGALILKVMKAVDAYLDIKSRQQRASTDANIPLSLGREAVAIGGGGLGGGAHTLQEWYDPANRDLGLRRILLAILALAQ
jgi:tripeptide aminopeptidase